MYLDIIYMITQFHLAFPKVRETILSLTIMPTPIAIVCLEKR